MNKYILYLILLMIAGCSQTDDYEYQPLKNVGVNVYVGKINMKQEGQTFIQFKYEINNNSDLPVKLNPGNIKVIVNGEKSEFVHSNNLASAPETVFKLKKGYSEHEFYLMVNTVIKNKTIDQFKVVDFGMK